MAGQGAHLRLQRLQFAVADHDQRIALEPEAAGASQRGAVKILLQPFARDGPSEIAAEPPVADAVVQLDRRQLARLDSGVGKAVYAGPNRLAFPTHDHPSLVKRSVFGISPISWFLSIDANRSECYVSTS